MHVLMIFDTVNILNKSSLNYDLPKKLIFIYTAVVEFYG